MPTVVIDKVVGAFLWYYGMYSLYQMHFEKAMLCMILGELLFLDSKMHEQGVLKYPEVEKKNKGAAALLGLFVLAGMIYLFWRAL